MAPQKNAETTAKFGFAAVTLLLAVGMIFAIQRLAALTEQQIKRVRDDEAQITLIERLRWTSEVIVSNGRGYLISGDPARLAEFRRSKAAFDANMRALRRQRLSARDRALGVQADRSARGFMRVQEELLSAREVLSRPASERAEELMLRFDAELLPLRKELERALQALVEHRQHLLQERYASAHRERIEAHARLSGLVMLLLLASIWVAWRVSVRLGRLQRRELESLDSAIKGLAARDEIMAIVAHDLRNPLNAIHLKASAMAEPTPLSADPERMRQQALSIKQIVVRMARLIDDMLHAATIESGKLSISPERCDVDALVAETFEVLGPLARAKHIAFESGPTEHGLVLRADRERILQVLSNLIGNAIKFTPAGGLVTLAVERDAATARFSIADTGPGIASDQVARIFERFWKSGTGNAKGRGLGLFIAKSVVEAHGGRLWVETDIGRGTTFRFAIPLDRPAGDVAAADPSSADGSASRSSTFATTRSHRDA